MAMARPERVIFVGLGDYSNAPTRIRCYNFARVLKDRGIDAQVFSFQDQVAPEQFKNQEMTAMIYPPPALKGDWVARAVPRLEALGPGLFVIQKLHYHAAAVLEVCRRHGWPYVLDYDDDDRDRASLFMDPGDAVRHFGVIGQEQTLAEVASKASFCLASSRFLQEVLARYNPRVHLLETVADTKRFGFTDRSGRDTNRIVWLGQIWGQPILDCLDLACRALQRVQAEGVSFTFHIVGRGMEDSLPGHLRENYPGLPAHIEGWADPDRVPGILANMDLGIFPLAPSERDYEWTLAKSPTKLFEYLASGLAVVATRLGEAARLGQDGQALFLGDDEAELAGKLKILLTDRQRRLAMGREARALVEREYSLEAAGDKLLAIINGEAARQDLRPPGQNAGAGDISWTTNRQVSPRP
jgi:glycosyltransferase involved in cell wall biosynthesis